MDEQLVERFKEELESFVFFHLGSDAKTRLDARPGAVRVELEHKRIRPVEFEIDEPRLKEVLSEPILFEEMMLAFLVSHRRS